MKTPRTTLSRLIELARPEARLIVSGIVVLVLGSLLGLAYPQGIRLVIDTALGTPPAWAAGAGPRLLDIIVLVMIGGAVVSAICMGLRVYWFSLAGERAVARLRERLYGAVIGQEVGFFDQERTGDLTSRLSADTATLQSAVSANISMSLRNAAQLIGGVVMLLFTSAKLTLLILAVVPLISIGAVIYGRRVRKLARQVQDSLADASAVAEETVAGIRTVRSFAAEEAERDRYAVANRAALERARKRVKASAWFMGSTSGAGYVAVALVFWVGGGMVRHGELSAGALTSFLVYTLLVGFSLGALADLWADFMRAAGAAERVFELLNRTPSIALTGGATPSSTRGEVAFSKVSFVYPSRSDVPVLSELDLHLSPGEVVAVVGPSGAGKSTLAALLARFYDPSGGSIQLDGRDLRELDPSWLRRQIGVVAQEPILFATSVATNIRYGRPEADDAAVEAAARAANADGFVRNFPEGYATRVGERGVQLSGGQKQRIAIARAVLKDPRILILDEATSALDAESEHLVKEALERLMQGRTTLVIAHRLSTVKDADRVVVLDGGRIVEQGSHDQLMAQRGLYHRLVERQFAA